MYYLNSLRAYLISRFMYSLEQMWKLLDDGTLLSLADQAHERMGNGSKFGPKMTWLNHPETLGGPDLPLDYYNSDGPWAFGPENEKGRFYIEHTELKGRLGWEGNITRYHPCELIHWYSVETFFPYWNPCRVILHTDPNSVGYRNPLMFKKEIPDMGDCPSCSNGFFSLYVPYRTRPYYKGEFNSNYLSGHFS